jgi:hypothetical protein
MVQSQIRPLELSLKLPIPNLKNLGCGNPQPVRVVPHGVPYRFMLLMVELLRSEEIQIPRSIVEIVVHVAI